MTSRVSVFPLSLLLLGLLAGASAGGGGNTGTLNCADTTDTTNDYTRYHCDWDGNGQPTCAALKDVASLGSMNGTRINSPEDSPAEDGIEKDGFKVDVTTEDDYHKITSWDANYNIEVIICKAGSRQAVVGGAFFVYALMNPGATGDVEIICPAGKRISHLDFCSSTAPSGGDGGGGGGSGTGACSGVTCESPPSAGQDDCATVEDEGVCMAGGACSEGSVCTDVVDGSMCAYKLVAKEQGTMCRAAAEGGCDVAATCDGSSLICPENAFREQGTECRAAAGDCDVAATCTGNSPECPENGYLNSSHVCRGAAGGCDIEETCTGDSPTCPGDAIMVSGAVCREAVEGALCDVAETCDGSTTACPVDGFRSSSHVCRPAAEGAPCDVEETCTGDSPTCPVDAKRGSETVCREADSSAGSCDVEEVCNGEDDACPVDVGLTSIGMTYKCATDIFLEGGLDVDDLVANKNRMYFAGDQDCNIGYSKNVQFEALDGTASALTVEGCAPALCPNNRGLSNMVWGTCQKDGDDNWRWACGGKLENGADTLALCPDRVVLDGAAQMKQNAQVNADELNASASDTDGSWGAGAIAGIAIASAVVGAVGATTYFKRQQSMQRQEASTRGSSKPCAEAVVLQVLDMKSLHPSDFAPLGSTESGIEYSRA